MDTIQYKQDCFFKALASIQDINIETCLIKYKNDGNLKKLLYNLSYDVIFDIMELIDGYYDPKVKLDLIDKDTDDSLRKGIELHDKCANYIKHE